MRGTVQDLADLFSDLQRDFPHWPQVEIVSQLRRTMPEYRHGVWGLAMPFNRDESDLPPEYRARFARLRQQAVVGERLDLAHVLTSIDVRQSVDIIRDAYASWAGDLGTHVLANLTRQAQSAVGSPDSLANLEDLHGDMDGDNIAGHMPDGQPVDAILAYYQGDEALMDGVTINSRYRTFARDMGLLDDGGAFRANKERVRMILRNRTREFIEFDEIEIDVLHPRNLLRDLFDSSEEEKIEAILETALDQFLQIIASGVEEERRRA